MDTQCILDPEEGVNTLLRTAGITALCHNPADCIVGLSFKDYKCERNAE